MCRSDRILLLVSFHFFYAGNGKHSATNHLIFNVDSFKNGTFFCKMERKWNALAQKRNGTKNMDNQFIIKYLLPTNGTKNGTKWNALFLHVHNRICLEIS